MFVIPAQAGIHCDMVVVWRTFASDDVPEILPVRVRRFDQLDLPFSSPPLDRFFPFDGMHNGAVAFVPDECFQPVTLREPVDAPFSMLPYSLYQI